ncbi:MAG TPA: hypothetical protein VKA21_11835 [Candidatus Binatia bacterium]|nr:hypothetical protein [Candidatus Binatia bacterium]
MSVRAVFVLGLFLLLAALLHGGIYTAGHDFVVNRFTGRFEFVPAEDELEDEQLPVAARALTAEKAGARVERSVRGAGWRAIRVGR